MRCSACCRPAQKLITTTHIDWMQTGYTQQIMRLSEQKLAPFQ